MPVRRARPRENRPRARRPRRSKLHLPPAAITEHSIRLAGVEIPYSAKAATLALRDARGKTLADIFYIAHGREPLDPKRPITFVFNGGPGAASAYLHLGAIGPRPWPRAQGAKCSAPLLSSLPMTQAGSTSPTSFRRSGRNRLQPRARWQGRERFLRCRAGYRGARQFHPALPHRCGTAVIARVSRRRKLRRLSHRQR